MRLSGIDSIRFICAFIVVLGHFGGPPVFSDALDNVLLYKIIHGIYNCLFNGPAAVIVFFIISGLVIHFPYVHGKELNVKEFYLKRYIRVIIPMVVVSLFAFYIHRLDTLGIFWSLYAELIYYTLYPIILMVKKKLSLVILIVTTYLIGLLLILIIPYTPAASYTDLGNGLTWIIGLPCWLAGLQLAEFVSHKTLAVSFRRLMIMRFSILALTVLLRIAKFHLELSNLLSLNLLAIPIFIWLAYEISYYKLHKPFISIESAGKWSYSLYIVHPLAAAILGMLYPLKEENIIDWIILISFVLASSYLFYYTVERPSHKLAQKIKIGKEKMSH